MIFRSALPENREAEIGMKLLLEPNLLSYSDEAYEADLKLLPSQRYSAAMRYRFTEDRKRCGYGSSHPAGLPSRPYP